jgi:hypothetical protein|tara:strand:+ start:137 stop:316 length:180 start_codon:yes stop_codon:yes gene_type:complete
MKKDYIIAFEEEGRKAGGRYRDEAHALEVNSVFGRVVSIVEGNMRDQWRRGLKSSEVAS